MYRMHIQCADVGWAAWPKPASLPARGPHSGLGESTTQTASMASGSAEQGTMRGVLPGRRLQERSGACLKSCLTLFIWSHDDALRATVAATTENDDTIHGSGVGDAITDQVGNDTLVGNGGNDTAWLTDKADIFRACEDWRLRDGVSVNDETWRVAA